MRVDYTTEAMLGEDNDRCLINVEIDDDYVTDIEVICAETGKKLNGLIYGGSAWNEAWSIAERRILTLPFVQKNIHRTFKETCHDTPYQ